MAIKIDLLPAYVKLRRDFHRSIAACIVVTGVVLGGLLLVLQQRRLELLTAQTNLAEVVRVAGLTTSANEKLAAATGKAAPVLTALTFMAAASKTGPQRAALIDQVRHAIYSDAIVSSIDISDGQNVNIKAAVRDNDEYATFLDNLRNASTTAGGTLFNGNPVANGPVGFPGSVRYVPPVADGTQASVPYVYPLNVTAAGVLLYPIQLPPDPVGDGAAGGTPGGIGGPPPGLPPGVPTGPPPGVPTGPPPGSIPPGATAGRP